MNKEIKKKIEMFEGTVVGIGLEEKWKQEIEKNKKVIKADFLDRDVPFKTHDKKEKKTGKTINIKNLKKIFPKKVDYLFVYQESIQKEEKTFIPDSLFITKKQIIIYGKNKEWLQKYEQFQKVDLIKIEKDSFLALIDRNHYKPSRIKSKSYYIKETIIQFMDELSNFLSGK